MGSVGPLRIDAELVGEERDRGLHPEALVRSNRIVYRLPVPARCLHARQIGLALVALPPFRAKRPVQSLHMSIQFRAVWRQHPERNRLRLTCLLELSHELAPAVN